MSDVKQKTLKKFTSLEKLVLKKLVNLIDEKNYTKIVATPEDLGNKFPKKMITQSQRKYETLSELDINYLVYFITSDKADLSLRVSCLRVAFHKLNTEDKYPYMDLLTKEEFIEEAFIPEIKSVLLALHFKAGEEDEQNSKHIGREPSQVNVVKAKAKEKEPRRNNNGVIKPENLFN